MISRRAMTGWLGVAVLGVPLPAAGQSSPRAPVIGMLFLGNQGGDFTRGGRVFREGLRELGWVEGQNLDVRFRFANATPGRLDGLAEELVRERADVIVTIGSLATAAAGRATRSIPIVMAGVGDPVRAGLVTSLARPGGNITGVAMLLVDLTGKRLDLLKEMLPKISRIGILHAESPGSKAAVDEMQALARRLGWQARAAVFRTAADAHDRIAELRAGGAQALIVPPAPVVNEAHAVIAEAALKQGLPSVLPFREFVEAGGLMSYGPDYSVQQRRASRYVDLILKGTRPQDLPVEQPTHLELVVNRRTAAALGIAIPPAILLRADRVLQ